MARGTLDFDSLPASLAQIFDQAQTSTSGHRKNCVTLFKLQEQSANVTEKVNGKGGSIKLVGERTFCDIFLELLNRVLVTKKGMQAADRVIRFVGAYVRFMNEKMAEAAMGRTEHSATAQIHPEDEETFATRFCSRLLKHLLKAFSAKDKNVRFRSVALTAELMSSIAALDEELYTEIRSELLERLHDRESAVRSHACIALAKLSASEDPSQLHEGEYSIMETLLDALHFDPSPDVRRSAIANVPLTPHTLPSILTRTRDVDPLTRKVLFSTVLPRLTHPKQLTISQRETVVRHGLGDREEAVRVAAVKLLSIWLDVLDGDLLELLRVFDVLSEGGPELAADVLTALFSSRIDVFDTLEIDDEYWKDLNPERALLLRVYVDHAKTTSNERALGCLPVVTALAFQLQATYNSFVELAQEAEEVRMLDEDDEQEQDARDAKMEDTSFVVGELLRVALGLDYSDELGRRKMYAVVREMVGHQNLPEGLIGRVMDVLQLLSAGERDLIRIIVEVINEMRDPSDGQEDGHPQSGTEDTLEGMALDGPAVRQAARPPSTPEERLREDLTNLRCLSLCIGMLERVNGSFDENSTLEGILSDIVVPAVKRKEPALREKGLVALGLCCLIARTMAHNSLQLFLGQIQTSPEKLRGKILKIIFDMLMVHERDFLSRSDIGERIITFLVQLLESEEFPSVQAIICTGFCKLILCGLLTDEKILASLVLVYVSPLTIGNQELRQALSYFFPVYAYSSSVNQNRLRSVFVDTYDYIKNLRDDLEEDQEMIGQAQFCQLFLDWTDPLKVVHRDGAEPPARDVHVDFAIDILKALYDPDRNDEDRKTLCQLLSRFHIPEDPVQEGIWSLNLLLSYLQRQASIDDPATEKIIERFEARFTKQHRDILNDYDERKCLDIPTFRELYTYIGLALPSDAGPVAPYAEEVDVMKSATRRRRSSLGVIEPEHDAENSDAGSAHDPSTPTRKRPRPAAHRSTQQSPPVRKRSPTPLMSEEDRTSNHEIPRDSSGPEPERHEAGEDELEVEVQTPPSTPKRPTRTKRTRSPAQAMALKSPVPKRHQSSTARVVSQIVDQDVFRDTKNKTTRKRKVSREPTTRTQRTAIAKEPGKRPGRIEESSDGEFDI